MSYDLTALAARTGVLAVAVRGLPGAVIVPLNAGMELLPLTDELIEELDRRAEARKISFGEPGLQNLRGPALLARDASAAGPVAYLTATYFGGQGVQMSAVWERGKLAMAPVHCPRCGPDGKIEYPSRVGAINQALQRLGVTRVGNDDEFDTVGLGRKRHTEDWGK